MGERGVAAGASVASAGDVDGDGLADLVVGAFGNDQNGTNAGKSYLATAADMDGGGTRSLSAASYGFLGEQAELNQCSTGKR